MTEQSNNKKRNKWGAKEGEGSNHPAGAQTSERTFLWITVR